MGGVDSGCTLDAINEYCGKCEGLRVRARGRARVAATRLSPAGPPAHAPLPPLPRGAQGARSSTPS